jgi:hypothetical protein
MVKAIGFALLAGVAVTVVVELVVTLCGGGGGILEQAAPGVGVLVTAAVFDRRRRSASDG